MKSLKLNYMPSPPPPNSVTQLFQNLGIDEFFQACQYVSLLPYGRNSERSDFRLVISEGKGTCSTKHALLAQLARELGLPISLVLGIFEMNGQNMPEIEHVLASAGLTSIPEAHCYLRFENQVLDFTRSPSPPFASFCQYEEIISPDQIGDYKVNIHKEYFKKWIEEKGLNGKYTFNRVWEIRERCILAL